MQNVQANANTQLTTQATLDSNAKSLAIMLVHSPYQQSISQTALRYTQQLLTKGHKVHTLFFYHESVNQGSKLMICAQDETNIAQQWQALIEKYQLNAIVCIASGLKRGVIDQSEAKRYEKTQFSLAPAFSLGGLGEWIEAVNSADQHIVFS